jgi:hypothetical protein
VHTNHINILLPDYVRGILDKDDIVGVEEHLRNCSACQADLIRVREVLASIESAGVDSVPNAYFSSILPRVHQRLDRRKHFEWSKNPFLNKVILPLGAAIVVSFVLWRMPFSNGGMIKENPMMAVVDSATSEDFAEIVQDNIPSQEWSSFNAMVISHALTNDRFVRRELVREALASETTSPFDVFSDVSPQQVLSDFDESQTNEVLRRLGHTEIL